jgi:hypothetical protein
MLVAKKCWNYGTLVILKKKKCIIRINVEKEVDVLCDNKKDIKRGIIEPQKME